MITEYENYITYKCDGCGRVITQRLSPFVFSGRKSITLACPACREPSFNISETRSRYIIDSECPICGDYHRGEFAKHNFWHDSLLSINCSRSELGYIFIGGKNETQSAYRNVNALIQNAEIMYDPFEDDESNDDNLYDINKALVLKNADMKLHDFLENDNLLCRCGSKNISFCGINNQMCIRCRDCGSTRLFKPTNDFLSKLSEGQSFIFNKGNI